MELEQVYFISQIIAAACLLASIVFVGVQLRQNTIAVRAATAQGSSAIFHEFANALMTNRDFARLWRAGLADFEGVSPDDRVQISACLASLFRFYETSFVLWRRGQFDDEHWHWYEAQAAAFAALPGVRAWWQHRKDWHSQAFRDWFEKLPPPLEDFYAFAGDDAQRGGAADAT